MQRRIRDEFNKLCREFNDEFIPHFLPPSTLQYGDTPQVGTEQAFARSDHVHGMPSSGTRISLPQQGSVFVYRLRTAISGSANGLFARVAGTVTDGGTDGNADWNSYGAAGATCGFAAAWIILTCDNGPAAAADIDAQRHALARLRALDIRMRFIDTSQTDGAFVGSPVLVDACIGALRLGGTASTNTGPFEPHDGVFFRWTKDILSQGGLRVCAVKDGNLTSAAAGDVKTSPVRTVGATTFYRMPFQTFRIEFDGEAATFLVDGEVVGTLTGDVFPTSVAGYGVAMKLMVNTATATPNAFEIDAMEFVGVR